ncbi:hypothetical protein FMUND_13518 [Fusarium mundagurra]|uniref:Uncharacterized protein n=1 Tax=Fusarium mundagurra TaxID=1567541 RepID=A0A8H5XYU7_9HYPO|nr:hypothetical protein FMUND_13518 [Fusarium mundagurra]
MKVSYLHTVNRRLDSRLVGLPTLEQWCTVKSRRASSYDDQDEKHPSALSFSLNQGVCIEVLAPEADKPQGSAAGTVDEECICCMILSIDRWQSNIPEGKLSERELRLRALNEHIYQCYVVLQEAKEKLGVDSNVVKVLSKVEREASDHFRRVYAEKTPDVEAPADEVPDGQREVQTLEQRQLALESQLFLLRGNVIPRIEELERHAMALRAEMEGRRE